MISVGIDIGSQFVKVVVLRDESIEAVHLANIGTDAIEQVGYNSFMAAIESADIPKDDVDCITATGVGREYIAFADYHVSETLCNARGVDYLNLPTDVLLDMGADKIMVVKFHDGKPIQVFRNDRCASGTGRFLDIVAKPLGLTTEELGIVISQVDQASCHEQQLYSLCGIGGYFSHPSERTARRYRPGYIRING